jgi:hypothetical protein
VKALNSQLARVSEFRCIGVRELVKQVARHREYGNHDKENTDRKRSALTGCQVSKIRETYTRPLDS